MASIYYNYQDPCFCPGWIKGAMAPVVPLATPLSFGAAVWVAKKAARDVSSRPKLQTLLTSKIKHPYFYRNFRVQFLKLRVSESEPT